MMQVGASQIHAGQGSVDEIAVMKIRLLAMVPGDEIGSQVRQASVGATQERHGKDYSQRPGGSPGVCSLHVWPHAIRDFRSVSLWRQQFMPTRHLQQPNG